MTSLRVVLIFLVTLAALCAATTLAFAAGTPSPDQPSGWFQWIAVHIRDGHLKAAAGGVLVLLVWGIRFAVRKKLEKVWAPLAWLKTKWGSRALMFALGVVGGVGQALIAELPLSVDLVMSAVETTCLGIVGWEIARDKVEPQAPAKKTTRVMKAAKV